MMINRKVKQYEGICELAGDACLKCSVNPTSVFYDSTNEFKGYGGYCMYNRLSESQIKEIMDEEFENQREMERRWHFTFRM